MTENSPQATTSQARVLTVTELNRSVRDLLEHSFPLFWVSGEISNLTRAASGHWYFSLKDSGAQVRCVMFRGRNSYLDWIPKEGDKVEARALVTLYEARGDFQLTIEFLQRAGLGTLFEAFERLKAKLQAEGLFDVARKKIIPTHPKQIGIVTSADAAALRDVLTTLKRRMPSINVIIYPTPVQGKGAAEKIATAIQFANQRDECDVLMICRGGGSIEDLWSFNEEIVARAIAHSHIPTISGVGHETDFTICDFVADQRAATPTAAAELISPNRTNLIARLQQLAQQLNRQMENKLNQNAQQIDYLTRRLLSPNQQISYKRDYLQQLQLRLSQSIFGIVKNRQQQISHFQKNLAHLNPQSVLNRGFAMVENADGNIISDKSQVHHDDIVQITFAQSSTKAVIRDS
ncbi:MAG TPA: exodeoxyribonuclease VII large subunit [Methylophilaceae bacterium]|jgi:exodeoxyribonuclease VII large subunit